MSSNPSNPLNPNVIGRDCINYRPDGPQPIDVPIGLLDVVDNPNGEARAVILQLMFGDGSIMGRINIPANLLNPDGVLHHIQEHLNGFNDDDVSTGSISTERLFDPTIPQPNNGEPVENLVRNMRLIDFDNSMDESVMDSSYSEDRISLTSEDFNLDFD